MPTTVPTLGPVQHPHYGAVTILAPAGFSVTGAMVTVYVHSECRVMWTSLGLLNRA
jgi:hypothetical protein